MLRLLLERLSEGIILRRNLPRDLGGGAVYVSPENSLRYWRIDLSKVDPWLLHNVNELVAPGMSVWDVGANCGLFTFSAAYKAGTGGSILAIEPDVENVRLLLRTEQALDRARNALVQVLPVAVAGPGARIARFNIAARGRASNALAGFGYPTAGGVRAQRLVPVLTLDELLSPFGQPDVLKIDAEGAELEILSGAEEVVGKARPRMLIEVGAPHAEQVGDFFRRHGYRLFAADCPANQRKELAAVAGNCLALPNERTGT